MPNGKKIPKYSVYYVAYSSISGKEPVDSNVYLTNSFATIKGNTGNLLRNGYYFDGWVDLAGTKYPVGSSVKITDDLVLYAKWGALYKVVYDGNGFDSGSVPVDTIGYKIDESAVILGNTGNLVRNGSTFSGWNSQPDGSGSVYTIGKSYPMNKTLYLYAIWTTVP